ncbi:hypothetical protein CIB48_g852 [Xylaria polymorpha]|nr:hypothetical protein CIB48_g852 [Xylaria polymorpha]
MDISVALGRGGDARVLQAREANLRDCACSPAGSAGLVSARCRRRVRVAGVTIDDRLRYSSASKYAAGMLPNKRCS